MKLIGIIMEIEEGKINSIFFETLFSTEGQKQRSFSGEFSGELAGMETNQTHPVFKIPSKIEEELKVILEESFGITEFKEGTRLGIPCKIICEDWKIWGVASQSGKIFSIRSFCLSEEELKNDSFSGDITKKLKKFTKDYGHIEHMLSTEEKINSIVALYLLEKDESSIDVRDYYNKFLLKLKLENDLKTSNIENKKIKI